MVGTKQIEEEVDQPIIEAVEEDSIEVVIIIKIRIFIMVVIKKISLSIFPNSCFRLNSVTLNYTYITAFSQDNLIWWTIVFPY